MSETLVCSHNNNNNDVLINHAHIETLSYPNMPDNAGIRYAYICAYWILVRGTASEQMCGVGSTTARPRLG